MTKTIRIKPNASRLATLRELVSIAEARLEATSETEGGDVNGDLGSLHPIQWLATHSSRYTGVDCLTGEA